MKVIILSGPSGAGKSSWIEKNVPRESEICSSDHYHADPETGEYVWSQERVRETHLLCFRKFLKLLGRHSRRSEGPTILVDNTNTTAEQLSPYVMAAQAHGIEPNIVVFIGHGEGIFGRNSHGVPDLVVYQMAERVRDMVLNWPPYWPHPTLVPIQPGPSYRGPTHPKEGNKADPRLE